MPLQSERRNESSFDLFFRLLLHTSVYFSQSHPLDALRPPKRGSSSHLRQLLSPFEEHRLSRLTTNPQEMARVEVGRGREA